MARRQGSDSSFHLRTPRAVGALASPHRLELIAAMGDAGDTSIADLARRLGRSPHSLYYHVNQLVEAGIVVPVGTRRRGRRDEQVWRLAANRLVMEELNDLLASPLLASKAAGAMLRLTTQELQRAIGRAAATPEADRTVVGMRMKARLDRPTMTKVLRLMQQIESLVKRSNRSAADGDVYAITLVLTPAARTMEVSR